MSLVRSALKSVALAAACGFAVLVPAVADATPVVDGVLGASEYGGPTATVGYDASAPSNNFGTPTNVSAYIGYNIYAAIDSSYLYGLFQAQPGGGASSAGSFVNLYLDTNPATDPGSDLGFEINNKRAFIPGVAGYVNTPDLLLATSLDGLTIEFGIPLADLDGSITDGTATITFPAVTDDVVFRLSQAFGYSVAGGDSYGTDRLARLSAVAVPEPGSLALIAGGLLGFGFFRRRAKG